ncbi:MAG: 50S ribosomal protein L31e, partial [Candidatus Woesearchaeota archaeon]
MAEEKEYNIPLRKEFQKVPKYKRAKKAITGIKNFLKKHMKKEDIKIGPKLNEEVWEKGIKNPPHHVKVTAFIEKDIVYAEKTGFKFNIYKKIEKKKETPKDKIMEKLKLKDKPKKEEKTEKKETKEKPDIKKIEQKTEKKEETVKKTDNKKREETNENKKLEEKTEKKK